MAARLRKTLPKDLTARMDAAEASGDHVELFHALERCEVDARGGHANGTPLMMRQCTAELARWCVARGTDVNALDDHGRTALHHSVQRRFRNRLTPELLIELGADVHVADKTGLTPIHFAADAKNAEAVETLLRHGADATVLSRSGSGTLPSDGGLSPLEYALSRMSNADFVAMVPTVDVLLAAGTPPTERCRELVRQAAARFEFHRSGFSPEKVDETSAAMESLCERFGVAPPARRVMHDGRAPIVASAGTWRAQFKELWGLLVPSHGAAATVQGEVIRIAGRVDDEVHRNGKANWDADYRAMVDALLAHLHSGDPIGLSNAECRALVAREETDSLIQLALEWVARNPDPVALPTPTYAR